MAVDLKGKVFVLTGTLPDMTRDMAKAVIVKNGGQFKSSITIDTDYLVIGEKPGADKMATATRRGIPTIDSETFNNMLQGQISAETQTAGKIYCTQSPMHWSFNKGKIYFWALKNGERVTLDNAGREVRIHKLPDFNGFFREPTKEEYISFMLERSDW